MLIFAVSKLSLTIKQKLKIMKKIIFISFIAFALCSCDLTPKPKYELVEIDLPMESFINDFFIDNPNIFNNDITIEEGSKKFINKLSDSLKTVEGKMNLFDGFPLRLKAIKKNKKLGYVAQFDTWIKPRNFDYHYVSEINFDVFCVIPDSLVTTLKEDEYYILDGVYLGNLTFSMCEQMMNYDYISVWSPKVEISKDKTFSTEYFQRKVNLGCVHLLFGGIKKYIARETKVIEKQNN